jgi:hypothetical protein
MKLPLVVLPDVTIGLVKQLLFGVDLVFEQSFGQSFLTAKVYVGNF